MKNKNLLSVSIFSVLILGSASASALSNDRNVDVSADISDDEGYSLSIDAHRQNNKASFHSYRMSSDSVSTFGYKRQINDQASPFKVYVGLSGMTSSTANSKDGYALGTYIGLGYDIVDSGTAFNIGLTQEVLESEFDEGRILDISLSQKISTNIGLKIGYRKIDRENNGASDTYMDSGYLGFNVSF